MSLLCAAITASKCLSFPAFLLHLLDHLAREGWGDLGEVFSDPNSLNQAKIAFAKIAEEKAAQNQVPYARGRDVLDYWLEFGDSKLVQQWLANAMADDRILVQLLTGYMLGLERSGDKKRGWRFDLQALSKHISVEDLDARMVNLESRRSSLDALGQVVVDAYKLSRDWQKRGRKIDIFDEDGHVWSADIISLP